MQNMHFLCSHCRCSDSFAGKHCKLTAIKLLIVHVLNSLNNLNGIDTLNKMTNVNIHSF